MKKNQLKWLKSISFVALFSLSTIAFLSFQSATNHNDNDLTYEQVSFDALDSEMASLVASDKCGEGKCGSGEEKSEAKKEAKTSEKSSTKEAKSANKATKAPESKECKSTCNKSK